ncbi:MAG: ABC transporter permease [Luteimonas sp.]
MTVANQVPYVKSSWNSPVNLAPIQEEPTLSVVVYLADNAFFRTLGLRIIEGRAFAAGEYLDWAVLNTQDSQVNLPGVIVTRAVAARLFPDESAVGKVIYAWGDKPVRVIGIVERLMVPDDQDRADASQYAIALPIRISFDIGSYLIRTQPERRGEVLAAALVALKRNAADRVLLSKAVYSDLRRDFYSEDRSMALLLSIACALLLLITMLGMVGLSSFWVEQRTRQIGMRRALGATRRQILVYFQIENLVLVSVGIVLGMVLAYGINLFLMSRYELPRLPALYLPVGAAVLWLLGQASVLWPATRAASIPPAVATRHR